MRPEKFLDLRSSVRRYNSTSVLEIGSKECWRLWNTPWSNPIDWSEGNIRRNHATRLMLLASAGNPHRRGDITPRQFNDLTNAHYSYDGHTIQNEQVLDDEAAVIWDLLIVWEEKYANKAKNCKLKLSDVASLELVRSFVPILFLQRGVAFQNAGIGKPVALITRTMKLIELLDSRSSSKFSESFSGDIGMSPIDYCKHFMPCLGHFMLQKKRTGFCDISQLSITCEELKQKGLTTNSLKDFINHSSRPFASQSENSFRSIVGKALNAVSDPYQPFVRNSFLDFPLIAVSPTETCLPDPFSLTESCWNQISQLGFSDCSQKAKGNLISSAFEDYLEEVLFPLVGAIRFERIPRVDNDKRADFFLETQHTYIIIECKNSVMSADMSAYFQADKIAELWYRIHIASDQISKTVAALDFKDKPTIPVVLTIYEGIAASEVFRGMMEKTEYCSLMGFSIPPIVLSIHEFEHQLSDRSIDNWAQLTIAKKENSFIAADGRGHGYKHLEDLPLF